MLCYALCCYMARRDIAAARYTREDMSLALTRVMPFALQRAARYVARVYDDMALPACGGESA